MANFTPQEIEQFLQEFFDVVGARQYVGARYVPIFGHGGGTPVEWDGGAEAYEPLSIVYFQGDTYTSRRYVPSGIPIDNQDYWVVTGRFNAQVEQYRREVLAFDDRIDGAYDAVSELRTEVGDEYVPLPDGTIHPRYGVEGQVLNTLGNGDTMWGDPVVVTSEIAGPIIEEWLDDHPEATTTVPDGSVTNAKLAQTGGILSEVAELHGATLINADDLIHESLTYTSASHNGVTFSWDHDTRECAVSGSTGADQAFNNVYVGTGALPAGIVAGESYYVHVFSGSANLVLGILIYVNGAFTTQLNFSDGVTRFTVPTGTTGMIIRLIALANHSFNTSMRYFAITKNKSNAQLTEDVSTIPTLTSGVAANLANYEDNKRFNAYDILREVATYTNTTTNGVRFQWSADHKTLSVQGTATAQAFVNLYYNENALPAGMVAGRSYPIGRTCDNQYISISVLVFVPGGSPQSNFYGDGEIAIPSNATGMAIRVIAPANRTYDATVSAIHLLNADANAKLMDDVDTLTNGVAANLANFEDNKRFNAYDILREVATYTNTTTNGVRFQWSADHKTLSVQGTATAQAFVNMYHSGTALPTGIVAGKTYRIGYTTPNVYMAMTIIYYFSGGGLQLNNYYGETNITIPGNAIGMTIRVVAPANRTYDTTVTDIFLINAESNVLLTEKVNDVVGLIFNAISYDGTVGGVTFTWNTEKTLCHVTGQSSGVAFTNIINYVYGMNGLEAGQTYFIEFTATDPHIYVEFLAFNDGLLANGQVWRINESGYFTIPAQATRFGIRYRVISDDAAIDGYVSDVKVYPSAPNLLKAYNISTYKIPLLVSFVDDDTTNDTYVTRYFNNCMHNGVVGNYAVMTLPIDNGDTTAATLLSYEAQGFGMCIHCHDQRGDQTNYWMWNTRDLQLCRENLVTGMRKMVGYGFVNFNYWITPYGVHDYQMVGLARQYGMKCLASYDDIDANYSGDSNRYQIRRLNLSQNDNDARTSMAGVKSVVDSLVGAPNGAWLVITTHFNEWGGLTFDTTEDSNGYQVGYSRFNEIVQYVLSKGYTVVPFQEGFSYVEPYLPN